MTTDLLFTTHSGKGVAAKVILDHGAMKAADYGRLYAAFAKLVGGRAEFIEMHTLYKDNYRWGVWWAEHNCPDGVRMTLMVEPHTWHATYSAVRRHLSQQRDVKSFKTLRIDKFVNLPYYI